MFPLPDLAPEQILVIVPFILVGFTAQLVDGALGMAFGVITNTVRVSVLGVPPARASASVHLVEAFTTGASGLSHIFHGNVDWKLFGRLALPGAIGGVAGASLLAHIDGATARPFVMAYLLCTGCYLLWRALRMTALQAHRAPHWVMPLGLVGGFMDAAGGGGWGSVVTSNLLAQGSEPRTTIGTVIAAEFVLTLTVTLTFIGSIGATAFSIAAVGLIIGGLLAAPLGALLTRRIAPRQLLCAVAIVIITTSGIGLYNMLATALAP
ncbi:MAG: sulfite exporter TauE/SafE family protein [Rhodanobacteraceae bacterium]|nr:sulfite exporter TauE/SafE family protein [Rhodanobacteraceae bacterium]